MVRWSMVVLLTAVTGAVAGVSGGTAAMAQSANTTATATTLAQVSPVAPASTVSSDTGLSNPTVRPMIAALLAIAALIGALTWWFLRATRPFPDALDGLAGLRRVRRRRGGTS
jgi:hypothetical protein